jgi:hypothetical protein
VKLAIDQREIFSDFLECCDFWNGQTACSAFLRNRARNSVVTPAASPTTLPARNEKAIRRAALVTVRRTILERFPPGRERRALPRWADRVAGMTRFAVPVDLLWTCQASERA